MKIEFSLIPIPQTDPSDYFECYTERHDSPEDFRLWYASHLNRPMTITFNGLNGWTYSIHTDKLRKMALLVKPQELNND